MQCKVQLLVVNHNILMTYTLWVEEGLEWSHNPMTNKTTCSNNRVSELCVHCMGKLSVDNLNYIASDVDNLCVQFGEILQNEQTHIL